MTSIKHSQLLEAAKHYLKPLHECYEVWNIPTTPYICVAVEMASKDLVGEYESPTVTDIHNHIEKLLNYVPTLKVWLQRTHPEVLKEVYNSNLPSEEINNKLYQTRLAWIDDMIKYYKSQGL